MSGPPSDVGAIEQNFRGFDAANSPGRWARTKRAMVISLSVLARGTPA